MGLTIDMVKAQQFQIRVSREVSNYIKFGGQLEEAILGLALAAASMMSDEESPDIKNKYRVQARDGGVSMPSMLERVMSKEDALNLAAHLAVAAGDVGPQLLRRMAMIMETGEHSP